MADRPWATINHAAEIVVAGDMVAVRGGRYGLDAQVVPRNAGRSDAWITFVHAKVKEEQLKATRNLDFVLKYCNQRANFAE